MICNIYILRMIHKLFRYKRNDSMYICIGMTRFVTDIIWFDRITWYSKHFYLTWYINYSVTDGMIRYRSAPIWLNSSSLWFSSAVMWFDSGPKWFRSNIIWSSTDMVQFRRSMIHLVTGIWFSSVLIWFGLVQVQYDSFLFSLKSCSLHWKLTSSQYPPCNV